MKTLKHFISTSVKGAQRHSTKRKIIILKTDKCYNDCLKHLHSLGIKPIKTVKEVRVICCHVDKHANLAMLMKHPLVHHIENDVKIRSHGVVSLSGRSKLSTKQVMPWGVKRIQAPTLWRVNSGESVRVAVLDSGISQHPDLKVIRRFNTISKKPGYDDYGHGTHVAGTIGALNNQFGVVGVGPKVKLYGVKVLDSEGTGYLSDLVEGIALCIQHRIRVINMSLGSAKGSTALHGIIKKAYKKGIVIVASGGNYGVNAGQIDYPAKYKETIAVAATTGNNKIANFSSRGRGLDVAAPGVNVLSTYLKGTYIRMSGTSMSTPHVTGSAALLLHRKPNLSPARVKELLQRTAKRLSGYSYKVQGAGLINVKSAVQHIGH